LLEILLEVIRTKTCCNWALFQLFQKRDHRLAKSELSGSWTWNSSNDVVTSPSLLWLLFFSSLSPCGLPWWMPKENLPISPWQSGVSSSVLFGISHGYHKKKVLDTLKFVIFCIFYFWNTCTLNLFSTQQSTFAIFVSLTSILPTKGVLNTQFWVKSIVTNCERIPKFSFITIINNYSPKWRWIVISITFTNTEVNICFSICHTKQNN